MSKLRHAVGHAVDQRYVDYHNNVYQRVIENETEPNRGMGSTRC
jgi:hypothetical protein